MCVSLWDVACVSVGGCGKFGDLLWGLERNLSIWLMNMSAMALLSDGGYSLSCAVLNCLLLSLEMPIWNSLMVGVGLWHVFCLW